MIIVMKQGVVVEVLMDGLVDRAVAALLPKAKVGGARVLEVALTAALTNLRTLITLLTMNATLLLADRVHAAHSFAIAA